MLTSRLRSSLLTTALLAGLASNAFAGNIIINGHTNYRDGVGGEFNVRPSDQGGAQLLGVLSDQYTTVNGTDFPSADGTRLNVGFGGVVGFQTFCLEYNEYFTLGGEYHAAISTAAERGGLGGQTSPNSDPLSAGSGYLYTLFATGSLTGYTYTDGSGPEADGQRAQSAEKLQKAFWYLENEMAFDAAGGLANPFLLTALTKFGNPYSDFYATRDAARADNNGAYDVMVLNIWTENASGDVTQYNQSQLIMVSPPTTRKVPDGGATLMLLGLGLSGVAWLRRKAD